MPEFVAYYRVSTDRQGASGLGLDAQRDAVARYVADRPIMASFQEIESGRSHRNRPQLSAAIELCRKHRATLVIAKLDRLARDVHFISGLSKAGIEFVAVDMPQANRLTVHIIAAVAEHEREMISARTKAALAEAKKRGTRLGNPKWQDTIPRAWAATRLRVGTTPQQTLDLMRQLRTEGKPYRAIADHLNEMGLRTPRGFHWHNETIRDLLTRSELREMANA